MGQNVLEINDLSVKYKVYEGVLDVIPDLSLYVQEGERVGLVGETGSGKTTVLKASAAILGNTPAIVNKKELKVCGLSIDGIRGKKNVRKNVSMIFQDPSTSLNPTLKIQTQMLDILKSQFPKKSKGFYHEMMMRALKSVSMPAPERVLDSYPIQLSGGMRQRVCISMALMKNTKIIIADEPTTALDVTIEEQILELIDDLVKKEKKSLILVSHALGTVRKITDRLYVMYAGQIVESGLTKDIFDNPHHPYTIGLIDATPKLTGNGIADGIAGDIPSYLNPPKGCRFAPRCPRATQICREQAPVLEKMEGSVDRFVSCHNLEVSEKPVVSSLT